MRANQVTDLLHGGDLDVEQRLPHRLQLLDICLLAAEQVRPQQPRQLAHLRDRAEKARGKFVEGAWEVRGRFERQPTNLCDRAAARRQRAERLHEAGDLQGGVPGGVSGWGPGGG